MATVLSFPRILLVFYAILTGTFIVLLLIAKKNRKDKQQPALPRENVKRKVNIYVKILLIALALYLLATSLNLSLHFNNEYWLLCCVIVYATLFFNIYILNNIKNTKALFLTRVSVFIVILLLLVASSRISGFMPLANDEDRYVGYSYRILEEGTWKPYKYPENPYYCLLYTSPSPRDRG